MNTPENVSNKAAVPPPPLPTQVTGAVPQESTHTDVVPIQAQGFNSLRSSWPKAVRLIEFQVAPGFKLDKVLIGQTLFENKAWEGRRVEKDFVVTACVHNPGNDTANCKGIWFTEDVPQLGEPDLTPPAPAPANPPVVNAGAPQGPAPSRMSTVQGPPMPPQGQHVQAPPPPAPQFAPVAVGQVAYPQAGPPPPNMQPGQQHVQHISGPTMGAAPPVGAPVQSLGGNVQQHYGYQQVGGGGQQVIHMGGQHGAPQGQPDQNGGQQGVVQAAPGEIVVLLSRERCSKIASAFRGAIIMPQEVPAVVYPIEQALNGPQGQRVTPGMNEVALVLSHMHAQLVISYIKGSFQQEIEGLYMRFQQAAGG